MNDCSIIQANMHLRYVNILFNIHAKYPQNRGMQLNIKKLKMGGRSLCKVFRIVYLLNPVEVQYPFTFLLFVYRLSAFNNVNNESFMWRSIQEVYLLSKQVPKLLVELILLNIGTLIEFQEKIEFFLQKLKSFINIPIAQVISPIYDMCICH